jgi:hypothetical protein
MISKQHLLLGSRFLRSKYTQLLLGNALANTFPRKRLEFNKTVLTTRSEQRCYNRDKLLVISCTRVEAWSNTSTVTLRVVGGDGKRSLKYDTVNMVTRTKDLGPGKDCTGEDQ